MKIYSDKARQGMNATAAIEQPLLMLEINHADLVEPARMVHDNDDFPVGVDHLWAPGVAVGVGAKACPSDYTGRWYICTAAGVTGALEPAWPGDGGSVLDGSATWSVGGPQYRACAFRYTLPDDQHGQLPRAEIAIDNVGRDLMEFIEASGGGIGAEVRLLQAMRSTPDVIEWEITVDMKSIRANFAEISAELGFENFLDLPAVGISYRPDFSPGLF